MATTKITDLTLLTYLSSSASDVLPIVDIDADVTKKITLTSIKSGSFSGSFQGDGSGLTGVISASHAISASYAPGGGGTPGGSDTQVQFNDGSSFGGDSNFTWNKTSGVLGITGSTNILLSASRDDIKININGMSGGLEPALFSHTVMKISASLDDSGPFDQLYPYVIFSSDGSDLRDLTFDLSNRVKLIGPSNLNQAWISSSLVPYAYFGGNNFTLGTSQNPWNSVSANHITASGNISSSGRVTADTLVIGDEQTLSGNYGGIGSGRCHTLSGEYSFIGGGYYNEITQDNSFIGGGYCNKITTDKSFIGGGYYNCIVEGSAVYSGIGGGKYNEVANEYGFVGGGYCNKVSGDVGFIGGGYYNCLSGGGATIAGGHYNIVEGVDSFIGAGKYGKLNSQYSVIGGGYYNCIMGEDGSSDYGFIGAGYCNTICNHFGFIGAGKYNTISSTAPGSMILGGFCNTVTHASSSIVGFGIASAATSSLHVNSLIITGSIPSADPGIKGMVWNSSGDLKISV